MQGLSKFINGKQDYLPQQVMTALDQYQVVPMSLMYMAAAAGPYAQVLKDNLEAILEVTNRVCGQPGTLKTTVRCEDAELDSECN